MRKFIFSLTMLATFLLGASTVEAQNYHYEEIFSHGELIVCGGQQGTTYFNLLESPVTNEDCSEKKFRLVFDPPNFSTIKDVEYEFAILYKTSIMNSYQVFYTGTMYNSFNVNSFGYDFSIPNPNHPINTEYRIKFNLISTQFCHTPSQFTSLHFTINWKNLPNNGANRNFGLDGNFAYDIAPRVKCAGDHMELKLADEVVESLNCTYQIITGYPTPPVSCNGAYAGFIITKTDANWAPIDAPKYIGTQGFADAEGVNGSPNFLLENFTDPNTGLAKNIHLSRIMH